MVKIVTKQLQSIKNSANREKLVGKEVLAKESFNGYTKENNKEKLDFYKRVKIEYEKVPRD
ncbi:hypothetical protein [Bacillus thuringiensis]|uniref:hypothetical protein n=1 Tax=Bacillus thuringiensis TaxID=1428 RepID=UPI001EE06431|nr:hypothetical protein [Bacillus thuringiensis]MCG3424566.1 hypothetical protein [Bacillus thuringiensis]